MLKYRIFLYIYDKDNKVEEEINKKRKRGGGGGGGAHKQILKTFGVVSVTNQKKLPFILKHSLNLHIS